ncbi:phosphoglycerate mutase family protein [Mucor ambiguus]|uniref:Phosphoglycerate mutase family protein n=1 Tax=Mucor ambiguus TaxID=91626 RepID=A0A0C9MPC5_9FUNG|nr:phosphoglycerate mutase family protein [Mucor ambiguus]
MVVQEVWVLRHGYREDWVNDTPFLPTNLRNDPPLSELGRKQSQEVANYLKDKSINRIYSSPMYRVLETVYPLVEACDTPLFVDYSMAEFYGIAHGSYLPVASLTELKQLFPKLNITDHTSSIPLPSGVETVHECHLRVKRGLDKLIAELDAEPDSPHTILLSGHAASAIAAVRALLRDSNYAVRCGTCSLSRLVRQQDGTWSLVENGSCAHLSDGEQRSWMFSGDIPDYSYDK